ncbi:MAG: hypothetical protein EZS28_000221 [Streblomastix strix]|uniref:Uncharacterized protein n=1 Tax=Streblomastix strix TaxID=222440 RepID=A0A5J4XAX6_9EUKA|nr:MAG: hypothetical protein EZS28_000221 [Streblomastix strix]
MIQQPFNKKLARQQHFRGYYLLNADITSLPDSADGDFAFSAESEAVQMFDTNWYYSGQVVPNQVTPASDAVQLVDNATGASGVSNEQSRGTINILYKFLLSYPLLIPQQVNNDLPLKDSGTGTAGASNVYASSTYQHLLNFDPTVANVPLVNATAAANGTSDFQNRNDHVYPKQLKQTGLITSTVFIKKGAQATDVLIANGDSKPISDIVGDGFVAKTGQTLQEIQGIQRHSGDDEESEDDEDQITRGTIYYQNVSKESSDSILGRKIFKNNQFQIQPAAQAPQSLVIAVASQASDITRGLQISADGNTLSFNGSVITGTGATYRASSSESVNYSAGNPILWGVNSVDTNGGFYSDEPKVYWRAKPITIGSVPT